MNTYIIYLVVLLSISRSMCGNDKYDEKNGRHYISMGHHSMKHKLLFHDNPVIEGTWVPYPKVKSYNVCYPPAGSPLGAVSIVAFNVTNKMPKGKEGYAYVKSGGVGANQLCLHLKTRRGGGYNFVIDVWGANKSR
uniref:H-type lectin domain-containing protein n=1 Tax=Graphocephala atropunctata TaxID=36148 RepID=A0A1B6LS09_9HEMI